MQKNTLNLIINRLTFFEMTIFLKSSRLISFPSPTVFLNSCSSLSNDVLSKPVFGRVFVMLEMHSMIDVVETEFVPSISKFCHADKFINSRIKNDILSTLNVHVRGKNETLPISR